MREAMDKVMREVMDEVMRPPINEVITLFMFTAQFPLYTVPDSRR